MKLKFLSMKKARSDLQFSCILLKKILTSIPLAFNLYIVLRLFFLWKTSFHYPANAFLDCLPFKWYFSPQYVFLANEYPLCSCVFFLNYASVHSFLSLYLKEKDGKDVQLMIYYYKCQEIELRVINHTRANMHLRLKRILHLVFVKF